MWHNREASEKSVSIDDSVRCLHETCSHQGNPMSNQGWRAKEVSDLVLGDFLPEGAWASSLCMRQMPPFVPVDFLRGQTWDWWRWQETLRVAEPSLPCERTDSFIVLSSPQLLTVMFPYTYRQNTLVLSRRSAKRSPLMWPWMGRSHLVKMLNLISLISKGNNKDIHMIQNSSVKLPCCVPKWTAL